MSVWQWMAVMNGYAAVHSPEDKTLDQDEIEELGKLVDAD